MAQLYHWPVPCTICEGPAEYHCNTCGDVLCMRCRENHLKSNAGRNHDVVPYAERVEQTHTLHHCEDHPSNHCRMWCQTCNKTVCNYCVTSDGHIGHRFFNLDEKIGERRKEIQDQFAKYSSLLSDWQTSLEESDKMKEAYETDIMVLDRQIVSQADELCRQVRIVEKECRDRLQMMKVDDIKVLQDQRRSLTESILELKRRINVLEDVLRANDPSIILQDTMEETANISASFDMHLYPPVFTTGSSNIDNLREMLGSLSVSSVESSPKMHLLANPSVEIIINTTRGHSPAITYVGSGQAWMSTATLKLQLVDRLGAINRTVKLDFFLFNMATTSQGDILLPDTSNSCIRIMSMEGDIRKLFSTEWRPYSLCCLPDGDIVVTFKHDRRVVQYNKTGEVVNELYMSLSLYPCYVAHSQVNRQLYISEKTESHSIEARGRVLAYDITGTCKLQYIYTGSGPTTFTPAAVSADQAGHVLITDPRNNTVHILDKAGNFLQYLLTAEEGFSLPATIDVDSEGYAWIGESDTGKLKVVKYLQTE